VAGAVRSPAARESTASGGLACGSTELRVHAVYAAGRLVAFAHEATLAVHAAARYRSGDVAVPYVDINPHRSRPKWWGYVALAVLLVATIAVVSAALTHT
jgi:hypothetical protein